MIGSLMTSYARARAESLIAHCRVGFLERPERLTLLIIGALTEVPAAEGSYFLHKMPAVLWLIAILSHWTVAQRVYYTWKMTRALDAETFSPAEVTPRTFSQSAFAGGASVEKEAER